MKEGGQFWEKQVGPETQFTLSGRATAELRWQFEVTCNSDSDCMVAGIRNAGWTTTGNGQKVVDLMVKLFKTGLPAGAFQMVPYDGSECLVLQTNAQFWIARRGDQCRLGQSMQPG